MMLTGETAVVFGGGSSSGEITNGLASGLAYAGAGANVVIADIDAAGAERARQTVREQVPDAEVLAVTADVTDSGSVAAAVRVCLESFGRIDVLHNNVGIAPMGGPLEMSVEAWERTFRVNLTSAFITAKHVLPVMLEQGGGSIVNIASVGGMRYIGYDYPAYAASKAGLIEFTKSLAIQYGRRGVRANAISPGYIASPMMYRQIAGAYDSPEAMRADRERLSPTGSMGEPGDVAAAALFLASKAARYVNGVCLPVDGGLIHQVNPPTAP
ncbi:SDR family NAD(P)-dependent oxidoreductase [Sediminivirga luteola]|uniref:Dehydrogenase n=1 Tax=Sediminivirga luteola TaxID=1774748 RepID=A0A8J2TZP9_9MICO|nr:SDR family oxidoreductase [Sediminivirga luteola]MCI2265122.1 SDR family oxidoreductase [Sediminivirga luteola]GGA21950.1 dehydrogenase [Sediminivirga luteola]